MRNIKPVLFVTVLFIITFLAYGAVWYNAEAYNLGTAYYNNTSFDPSGGAIRHIFLNRTGTYLYVADIGTEEIKQYELTTPWLISSAINTGNIFDTNSMGGDIGGIFISPDGIKLYAINPNGTDRIEQYTLGSSWDISTAIFYGSSTLSFSNPSSAGVTFSEDGTKFYVTYPNSQQYNLTTAWDITTSDGIPDGSFTTTGTTVSGGTWRPDGLRFYYLDVSGDRIREASTPVAWDSNNLSNTGTTFDFTDQITTARDTVMFKWDTGTKMWIAEDGEIHEYLMFTNYTTEEANYGYSNVSFIKKITPRIPYDLTSSTTVGFHSQIFFINDLTGTAKINVYNANTDDLVYTSSTSTVLNPSVLDWYATTTFQLGNRYRWETVLYNSENNVIHKTSLTNFDIIIPNIDYEVSQEESEALLALIEAGSSTSTQSSAVGGFLASIGNKLAQKHPFAWVVDLTNLFIDQRQDSSTTTLSAGVNFSEIDFATSSPLGTLVNGSTEYDIKLFDSETMFSLIPEGIIGGLRALVTAVLWVGLAFNIFNRARTIV